VLVNPQIIPQMGRQRNHAADTAKGIAILFVLFGHAWRGIFGAGILQNEALFHRVDDLIYAWHMPMFFFLSGLQFLATAQKQRPGAFVFGRVQRLLWPMVIWTWIFFGFKLAIGQSANTPVTAADFPYFPLPPYEHLWFLWALFLVQLAVFAFAFAVRPLSGLVILRWVLAAIALVLVGVLSVHHVPSDLFELAIVHLPYFLTGAALARLSEIRPSALAAAAAVIGVAALLYLVTQVSPAPPISLALVLLIWVLVTFVDREKPAPGRFIAVLRYLGQASMAIYLVHTFFSASVRIVLMSIGVSSVPFHVVAAVLVGTLGSLAVLWLVNRTGLRGVFGL
jgi:fucose 4-O-acetylase-like acetyltransferase